eukprot:550267_1
MQKCVYSSDNKTISCLYVDFAFPTNSGETNIYSIFNPSVPSSVKVSKIKMDLRGNIYQPAGTYMSLAGFLTHNNVTVRLFGSETPQIHEPHTSRSCSYGVEGENFLFSLEDVKLTLDTNSEYNAPLDSYSWCGFGGNHGPVDSFQHFYGLDVNGPWILHVINYQKDPNVQWVLDTLDVVLAAVDCSYYMALLNFSDIDSITVQDLCNTMNATDAPQHSISNAADAKIIKWVLIIVIVVALLFIIIVLII